MKNRKQWVWLCGALLFVVMIGGAFFVKNRNADNTLDWLKGTWVEKNGGISQKEEVLKISDVQRDTLTFKRNDEKTVSLVLQKPAGDNETLELKDSSGTKYYFEKISNDRMRYHMEAKAGLLGLTEATEYVKAK